ncbi:rifin [Plasmodium falciparum IGH-CR14]|uniref:Rifin n=1 Tax=Plasmodium falciparum IGH-CR14 TaxID=580059 RepID=A0A0L1I6L5_PLAFA|nr:rifin [Plasmodium falciparum IGH-CR14]
MKVHYINILWFAVPLNILVTLCHVINTHKKPSITPRHIQTNRLLCECELYIPNYDNDPEMKRVMQNFHDRTTQRFQEYDEKLQEKRQIYKDKCDKEIQKIILKDKLEKELTEKFAILQTDIHSDAIPTCICEKSIADKVEKGCLRCAQNLGGVAPAWGLVSGLGYAAWTHHVAITVAKAATDAGVKATIEGLIGKFFISGLTPSEWTKLVTVQNYANENLLGNIIRHLGSTLCGGTDQTGAQFCLFAYIEKTFNAAIKGHIPLVVKEAAEKAATAEIAEASKYTSTTSIYSTSIIASVIAIVVIVLVMVIIYLILRYRRKTKMKKKLQYIKLLKE